MNNNNRRRQQNHNRNNTKSPTRSLYRKPPRGYNCQETVPSWERRFCYAVGLVPWRKVLEAKKLMYLYENIVQWDDSAGEEAFYNAKNRFWAEINGLPCDISLPDPDMYIDKVDWNCDINPELLLDLEREPKVPEEGADHQEVVIFGSVLVPDPPISCTGWGEAEEEPQKTRVDQEQGNFGQNVNTDANPWDCNHLQSSGVTENNGGGNSCNDTQGWVDNHNEWETKGREWVNDNHNWNNDTQGWVDSHNEWEKKGREWVNDNHNWNNVDDKASHEWGTWDDDNRNKEDSGRYMSRYKTTRFPKDNNYQSDRGWWQNGRGRKRVSFAY